MTRRAACTLLLLVLGGGLSATARGACFEGLGFLIEDIIGMNYSEAYGVSGDGSVILGWALYDVLDYGGGQFDTFGQAVMWKNGVMIPVISHAPGSYDYSRARAASWDGSVIVGNTNGKYAWRWEGGTATDLDPLPTDHWTSADDVSSDGSVVVGYSTKLSDFRIPVRWDNGVVSALDLLPGGNGGKALGVSDDGSVVVGWSGRSGEPSIEAVRWQDGEIQGLGFLVPCSTMSQANGVSGDGLVVVGKNEVAFRWEGGTMTSLGGPPELVSTATATNADGSVIVGYGGGSGAFRWTEATGMRRLRDLLTTQYGLDLTGWSLSVAWDISADGNTIVGYGLNPEGKKEAFRASLEGPCRALPPVPTMSPGGVVVSVLVLIAATFMATHGGRRPHA